jgi:hypothetical protein
MSTLLLLESDITDAVGFHCTATATQQLCYHYKVALADRLKPGWRGDAGNSAVPVFIEERLEFADDTGRVKVQTLTSTLMH